MVGFKELHEVFSSFLTVKKFSDKRINSTPSIFNKSITKGFFKFLISFFWNSLFPTSEIVKSDRNFKEFGFGVGLAFGVVLDKDLKNGGTGTAGTISWGGYWNTSYFADPNDKVIGVIFKQTQNIPDNSSNIFRRLVVSSVVK